MLSIESAIAMKESKINMDEDRADIEFEDTPAIPTAPNAPDSSIPENTFTPQETTVGENLNLLKHRDRIVVIGRRQAGKTLYTSMLYWALWSQPGKLSMRAIQGSTHIACLEVIQSLRDGRWPSATSGSRYLDFDVTYQGRTRPLIMLDYPGEVFRRAFLQNESSPDIDELLDHIDRAKALILLIDPATASSNDLVERADDAYGMVKTIERLRTRAGGDNIPVSLVLTKYDIRKKLIEKSGGIELFIRKYFPQLIRELGQIQVFKCSVCFQKNINGVSKPKISSRQRPFGVVAPLQFVLNSLNSTEEKEELEKSRRQRVARFERENHEKEKAIHTRNVTAVILTLIIGIAALIPLVVLVWKAMKTK